MKNKIQMLYYKPNSKKQYKILMKIPIRINLLIKKIKKIIKNHWIATKMIKKL